MACGHGGCGGRTGDGRVRLTSPYTVESIGVLPPTADAICASAPTGFVPATMWRVPSDLHAAEIGTVSGRRSFDNRIGRAVSVHGPDGEGKGFAQIGTRHAGRHNAANEVGGRAVYLSVVAPVTNAQTPGAQQTRAPATQRGRQFPHGTIRRSAAGGTHSDETGTGQALDAWGPRHPSPRSRTRPVAAVVGTVGSLTSR